MALRLLPARLPPARLVTARALAHEARAPCTPAARPPHDARDAGAPAPCQPAARPPCRAPAARPAAGLRVTCCPAGRGARPPCARPPPPPPLACSDLARTEDPQGSAPDAATAGGGACGARLDLVARRLAAAERARRAAYENELAARQPRVAPPRRAYRLAAARECLRATDGRRYSVRDAAAPARCGPGRQAPAPRAVLVEPFDACRPSLDRRPDPCAHRPKIFLEVDRASAPAPSPAPPAHELAETRREVGSAVSPSPAAGLLRRLAGVGRGSTGRRRLHTETAACGASPASPGVTERSSEVALRERGRWAEAARGRELAPAGGALELRVPPSAEALRVRVSVDFAAATPRPSAARAPDTRALSCVSDARGPDSWLSIKKIHKRITDGWRDVEGSKSKKRPQECSTTRPAAPAPSPSRTPAARQPCGPCGPRPSQDKSRLHQGTTLFLCNNELLASDKNKF
ncbi:translation initiation factor IF-2-like isoform X2 [Bicyclus anynana]|nr:translation initiation factor IF-2-like isoform X2 [Bicyclus anynana]